MRLQLKPLTTIVFRKNDKTKPYTDDLTKKHEELLNMIKPQLNEGEEVPSYISENDNIFIDNVGNSTQMLGIAIKHAEDFGLKRGIDFTSVEPSARSVNVDWLTISIEGTNRFIDIPQ